jgi:three-Cys-motif partner protein
VYLLAELKFDEINYWSEVKLDIVKSYAQAFSAILAKQSYLKHVYIDAFAGAGKHISKATKEVVAGSPLNALNVKPPFDEYHFIDIEQTRVEAIISISKESPGVYVYEGDCNEILIKDVFPKVLWKNYRRGLCLLDPYGLHLNWEVIRMAGTMKSIEIFLNFPVMDMNRNVFWRNPDKVDKTQIERMNMFWGDESWRDVVYESVPDLFGEQLIKTENHIIAEAFRKRLQETAGFSYVPEPLAMKNNTNAIVYYLFFASQNPTGQKIANDIFNKYRKKGM